MKKIKKRFIAITIASFMIMVSCLTTHAEATTMDVFFKEYGESESTFDGINLLSLVSVRNDVNEHLTTLVDVTCDLHCQYNTTAEGGDYDMNENAPSGPYQVSLDIEKGVDYPIKIKVGTGEKAENYSAFLSNLSFNTSDISLSDITFDNPKVLDIGGTLINGATVQGAYSTSIAPQYQDNGYNKTIDYTVIARSSIDSNALDAQGYTIKTNKKVGEKFHVGFYTVKAANGDDTAGMNAIQFFQINFTVVEPTSTTTPLQAPTLTLESDADNGGLKYTVTDNVNNGKASSYGIDLFSDVDCSNKVGNTINVGSNALSGNIPLSTDITEGTTYYAKVKAIGDGTNYSNSVLSTAVSATASAVTQIDIQVLFSGLSANGSASLTTSE